MNTQKWLVVIGVSLVLIVGVFILLYSADTTDIVQVPPIPVVNKVIDNKPVDNQPAVAASNNNAQGQPAASQPQTRSITELQSLVKVEVDTMIAKIKQEAKDRQYTEAEKQFLSDKQSFVINKLLAETKINAEEAALLKSAK